MNSVGKIILVTGGLAILMLIFSFFQVDRTKLSQNGQNESVNQFSSQSTPPPSPAQGYIVNILPDAFVPGEITLDKDEIGFVVFINKDDKQHWPVADTRNEGQALSCPSLDPQSALEPDEVYEYKIEAVGECRYYDRLHPELEGKYIVQ